jgi:gamma-glutamylcysteine synthetase
VKDIFLVHGLLVEHTSMQESVIPQNAATKTVDRRYRRAIEGQQGIAQPAARMVVDEPATLVGGMARLGRHMAKLAQLLAQAQAKLGGGAFSEGNDQDLLHARAVIEQQLDNQVLKQVRLTSASRCLDYGMPRAQLVQLRRSRVADGGSHVAPVSNSK